MNVKSYAKFIVSHSSHSKRVLFHYSCEPGQEPDWEELTNLLGEFTTNSTPVMNHSQWWKVTSVKPFSKSDFEILISLLDLAYGK